MVLHILGGKEDLLGVFKVLWKLRGLIAFVLGIIAVAIVVAVILKGNDEIKAPTVATANAVKDVEPNNSLAKPQHTGLTLSLKDWVSIEGKFDANDDTDRYVFTVADGANGYDIQTWSEVISKDGKPKELTGRAGILGVNDFPITIVCYNKANKVLTNILLAGSMGGGNFPEGTTKITVLISANTVKEGEGLYEEGREYKVYLKGRFKEPRKEKEQHKQ